MDTNPQLNSIMMALAVLKRDLETVKGQLHKETPVLLTETAVEGFMAYLKENVRSNTARSFEYPLRMFQQAFPGENVATIAPARLQDLLAKHWGAGKRSVLKQTLSKFKWFYGWGVKYVQIQGMPPFLNPCDLIEVKDAGSIERPDFIPVEKMKEFLGTAIDKTHWLLFAIMASAGLRISEVIGDPRAGKVGLRREDVAGRIITLRDPKSGRDKEIAVIPREVAERLAEYMRGTPPGERIFKIGYSTVYDIISVRSKRTGLALTPHDFRKWCATFWNRLGEYSMTNLVLRHASTKIDSTTLISSLGARYVAPLSMEEVMAKQDLHMQDIFKEEYE